MTSEERRGLFLVAVLFGVTAMVHQVTVLSWGYCLATAGGRHDIDFATPMATGGPSLAWGAIAAWLAMRVRRDMRGALVTSSLIYFLLLVSVLPFVCLRVHGVPPYHAFEALTLVMAQSVIGLAMGMAWLLMLRDAAGLLPLLMRGLVGVAPLLLLLMIVAASQRRRAAPSAT